MLRRDLLQTAPALAALLLAESHLSAQSAPPRLTRESLREALNITGLAFSDAETDQMRSAVERALGMYSALRAQPVPLDTHPAFHFDPILPGMKRPAAGAFTPTVSRAPRRFKKVEELAFAPVTELSALIRARRVTSLALTRMYLERLKRHSETLRCLVTLTEPLALEQATLADREIDAGKYRGALHGIPCGIKDLFATKGYKTTWGAEPFADQVLDYDATIVTKLRQAGAVLCAKLSMGALALGGQWFGGMTRNPWNTEKTSSGSSAGSASATAAGLVAFTIGTETLGSILTPSRICGVTGLRPTFGRVSRHGAMSLCWTMDKVGPICRTVEDCMLVLHAIEGPDNQDITVSSAPLAWNPHRPLSLMRIAFSAADFARLTGERKQVADAALAVLRQAGAKLTPVELPNIPTGPLLTILNAEAAAAFDDITRDGSVTRLSGQRDSDWPNTFRAARLVPAVEYIRAMRLRTLLMREMDRFMSRWDVVVTPSSSPMLAITNLTGHPQIGVPSGFIGNEPEAIHFTAGLFLEGAAARVAKTYQDKTGWTARRPPAFTS